MRPHPYLRAYMAGVTVPTVALLAAMAIYAYFRFYFEVQSIRHSVARSAARARDRVPDGRGAEHVGRLEHASPGASLACSDVAGAARIAAAADLIPFGIALARILDVFTIQLQFALPMFPVGMAVYYLDWKYLVGFLTRKWGIA